MTGTYESWSYKRHKNSLAHTVVYYFTLFYVYMIICVYDNNLHHPCTPALRRNSYRLYDIGIELVQLTQMLRH